MDWKLHLWSNIHIKQSTFCSSWCRNKSVALSKRAQMIYYPCSILVKLHNWYRKWFKIHSCSKRIKMSLSAFRGTFWWVSDRLWWGGSGKRTVRLWGVHPRQWANRGRGDGRHRWNGMYKNNLIYMFYTNSVKVKFHHHVTYSDEHRHTK